MFYCLRYIMTMLGPLDDGAGVPFRPVYHAEQSKLMLERSIQVLDWPQNRRTRSSHRITKLAGELSTTPKKNDVMRRLMKHLSIDTLVLIVRRLGA